jgi:hypothetical protein
LARSHFQIVNLNSFKSSLYSIRSIVSRLTNIYNDNPSIENVYKLLPDESILKNLDDLIENIEQTFILDECCSCISKLDKSIFQENIYSEIDNYQKELDIDRDLLDLLCQEISMIIDEKQYMKDKKSLINKAKNSAYNHFLYMTPVRVELFKKILAKPNLKTIRIGHYNIKPSDFQFFVLGKGKVRIDLEIIHQSSNKLINNTSKIRKIISDVFTIWVDNVYKEYSSSLNILNDFIAEIDFIQSCALIAVENGYYKPQICTDTSTEMDLVEEESSYLDAKDIRHPIIEKIQTDIPYVPNDIQIGKDVNGYLLFGVNACGKCLGGGTEIIMYNGELKKVENIQKGNLLMGDDSTSREVLSVTKGQDTLYEIKPTEYGDSFIVNSRHELTLLVLDRGDKKIDPILGSSQIIDISLNEFLKKDKKWCNKTRLIHVGVNWSKSITHNVFKCNKIEPFIYGCNIGRLYVKGMNQNQKKGIIDYKANNCIDNYFKYGSKEDRIKVLMGIFHSIGYINENICCINTRMITKKFANEILFITRSIGWKTEIKENYLVSIINILNDDLPMITSKFKVNEIGWGDYYGFECDKNHRFLLKDFTVTHNSSHMKAIGINLIMAQAGMFVASSDFKYKPFKYLFTRIQSNDNIFAGLSTFALEMSEFKIILNYADKNSIILGDELCSGTETLDATAIVASGIMTLAKRRSNFIFATHLHYLSRSSYIKELDNVVKIHMSVVFDESNNKLIYERKIKEGSGPDSYGIEVCRGMKLDSEFMDLAQNIRNELSDDTNKILGKQSRYNSNKWISKCEVCIDEVAVDTHHIKFQCSADENNMIDHWNKDDKFNLVGLCKKCHNSVHSSPSRLKITGYKKTSNGIELNYKKLKEVKD